MTGAALLLVAACGQGHADIPPGCYYLADGTPLLKIAGATGTILSKGGLKSFEVGPALGGHDIEVTPAFILHNGVITPPAGPVTMIEPVKSLPWGKIRFEKRGGRSVLLIPIEAYGEARLSLGPAC